MYRKLSLYLVLLVAAGTAYGFNPNEDPSLIGLWTLDEGTGTTAFDQSGKGHDGTIMNGPAWATGYFGNALDLNASGAPGTGTHYVNCGNHADFNLTSQVTLAAWIYPSRAANSSHECYITKGDTSFSLKEANTNGNVECNIHNAGAWYTATLTGRTSENNNTWYHLTGTFDGANIKIYLNGVLSATTPYAGTIGTNSANVNIGRDADSGGRRYYRGRIDDVRIYNRALTVEEIQMLLVSPQANKPVPATGATDVPRDGRILSWTPGNGAVRHDVYFGTDSEAVASAAAGSPLLVSAGQDPNTLSLGRLELGETYYWRVDEVGADGTVAKGYLWHFAVEPMSLAIASGDITATASSFAKADQGPEKTVDGSGLNANDEHSTRAEDMWLSAGTETEPVWIQYAFDKTYALDKMLVWNSNDSSEPIIGFGAKNVTIEYSLDGAAWTALGDFELARGIGAATYTANSTIPFGVAAKFVKLTIQNNWGGLLPRKGLSEVRFLYVPVAARSPSPDPNAADVHPQVLLSWRAGRQAGSHDVYLGTDPNAVADGAVAPVTVAAPSYDVALNLDTTYYWKVTEVNQTASPSAWDSDLWFFATASYVGVDDFESYTNDSPMRIFQTWIDGAGYTEPAPGVAGNGTGALVGHDPSAANFSETIRIYDGRRSMPLYYDNSAAPKASEAVRTFTPPQDWSKHGITTLVLYFMGDPSNAAAPVYVKINGTKVLYNNGAPSTTSLVWKQWNIPLASVAGLNLKSINTLAIGVGDGASSGAGLILVDAIRLYATPPEVVAPVDPGTNGLAAMYSFENSVQDGSGKNLHGTANGDPAYAGGPVGNALVFDGVNDSVDLPIGSLIGSLSDATFAVWVNYSNAGGVWQRAFDFNSSESINMFLTPDANNDNLRFSLTRTGSGGEEQLQSPQDFPAGWHHAAITIDSATMTMLMYVDGRQVDSEATLILPKDLGVTANNYLGRSAYAADPYFNGSLDELRIYNRALSEAEIRYLAGDR